MKRFSLHTPNVQAPGWDVVLILDNLRSAHNVGNIFRIAEALQCRIIACGCTPFPPHPVLAKTAMEADKTVPFATANSASEAIKSLRERNFKCILALEHNSQSVDVADYGTFEMPLALVLGNEAKGVSREALELCDGVVELPMLGKKASINVGNAAAAALYIMYSAYKKQVNIA